MNMSMNLTKISLAVMVLGMAVGCSKQDAPIADTGTASSPIEATDAAPSTVPPSASGAVALTEYDTSVVPAAGGNCALDAINGAPVAGATVKTGSETMFGGWIADAANQVPTEARLVLKGADKSYSAPLVAGAERLDVATALEAESLKLSGYNVSAKLDVVPGTFELSIVHGPAGAAASCALNAPLVVTD